MTTDAVSRPATGIINIESPLADKWGLCPSQFSSADILLLGSIPTHPFLDSKESEKP